MVTKTKKRSNRTKTSRSKSRSKSSTRRLSKSSKRKQRGGGKTKVVIPLNQVESEYRKMLKLIENDVRTFSKSPEFLNKYFPNTKDSSDHNAIHEEGLRALGKIEDKLKSLMKVYMDPSIVQSGSGKNNNKQNNRNNNKNNNNNEHLSMNNLIVLKDGAEKAIEKGWPYKELFLAFFMFNCIVFRMEGTMGITNSITGLVSYLIRTPYQLLPLLILSVGCYLMSYGGIKLVQHVVKQTHTMRDKMLKDMDEKFNQLDKSLTNSGNIFDKFGRVVVFVTNQSIVVAISGKELAMEKYKKYKEVKNKATAVKALEMTDPKLKSHNLEYGNEWGLS